MMQLQTSNTQKGLTLVELLISLTLGLLLSAAATQLFSNGLNMYRVQSSVSSFQDTATFGLNFMEDKLALANQGSTQVMNANSAWTGIVVTSSVPEQNSSSVATGNEVGNLRGGHLSGAAVTANLLSVSGDGNVAGYTGTSNIKNTKSDQLVIQYRAPFDMVDCEGNTIKGPRYDNITAGVTSSPKKMIEGDVVIERYFMRNASASDSTMVLACDAGHYIPPEDDANVTSGSFTINNYGDDGTILMKPVDYFHYLVGIKMGSGVAYVNIHEYNQNHADKTIIGLQLGIIARAKDEVTVKNPYMSFELLDKNNLELADDKKYLRRTYTNSVKFRNSRDES